MSFIYSNNYTTIHTKFQSRDNDSEGCRRVKAKARARISDKVINNGGGYGEEAERYMEFLIQLDRELSEEAFYFAEFYTITRAFNKATAREYKSSPRRKSSDAKRTSSGDSGDPDQPEPPRSHYLTIPQSQQNSFIHSWRTTPNSCLLVGGGRA